MTTTDGVTMHGHVPMEGSRVLRGVLLASALTLVIFGGWRLLDPGGFYAFSGLPLPQNAGLLRQVRGAGGIIVVSGSIVARGAFRPAWSRISAGLAAVILLSFGLARLLSIALDGFPGAGMIQGMAVELVLGSLALVAFVRYGTEARGPR